MKQYGVIKIKFLASRFGLTEEEMLNLLYELLHKRRIQGEILLETDEFKIWVTGEVREIQRIKNSLNITVQQSSDVLYKHFIQRLNNLRDIKDVKTLKIWAGKFLDKLASSDEKMNLLVRKTPIPISQDETRYILRPWKTVYNDIREKFRKIISAK